MALFMNDTKVKSVYWNDVKAKKVYFNDVLVLSGEFAFTYTGAYDVEGDLGDNFVIRFKTSGTLTVTDEGNAARLDVFLVGGGGGGAYGCSTMDVNDGGAGCYTKTQKQIAVAPGNYQILIGAGAAGNNYYQNISTKGGDTSAFGVSAAGGNSKLPNTKPGHGVDGGSGSGAVNSPGGSNGGNGGKYNSFVGGNGQGTTTREFGEPSGKLYAGGGGGGSSNKGVTIPGGAGGGGNGVYYNETSTMNGQANTGGGGGGRSENKSKNEYGGSGGSGIVCIRNHR